MKAAADALALSSPALTRRIQSLERFIGTALFERQHNALQLTSDGHAFLAAISPHLDALALAVDRVSEPARGMRLTIAVPSLFASQRLMPVLPSLQREHPDLNLHVDTGADRLSRLNDGLDAAIAIAGKIDSKLYARVLEKGRVVALGSKNLRDGPRSVKNPSDLGQLPVLLHRDMPEAFSEWRKMAGLPNLEPRAINYYDAGQLILDAAAESMGVAFMLESHLNYSADSRLVKIFEGSVESPYAYWFACHPSALERPSVRYFHDWLFNQFTPT